MNALRFNHISKHYPTNKIALNHVSFEVQQGSFFGLLGLNGAGKSTLIKILSTLISPSEGTISLFELPNIFYTPQQARKRIGIIPQEINLPIFETVEETLKMSIYGYGLSMEAGKKRMDALLDALDLTQMRYHPNGSLSGGMKRKVMLARALLSQPQLLILDEPTTGLDIESRQKVWKLLKALNHRGMTIFLTSHYLEEIEFLCSDIGLLHRGQLLLAQPIDSLLKKTHPSDWKIVCNHWPEEAEEIIQRLGGERDGNAIYFSMTQNDLSAICERSAALQAAGFSIEKIEKEQMTLEKLLLNL